MLWGFSKKRSWVQIGGNDEFHITVKILDKTSGSKKKKVGTKLEVCVGEIQRKTVRLLSG